MRMQRKKRIAAFLLAPLLLCACTAAPGTQSAAVSSEAPPATEAPEPVQTPAADPVEALLQQMTLREKVGQLFMIRPDSLDPELTREQVNDERAEGVTELSDAMRATLQEYPVGGICHFGKNVEDPEQMTRFNADLQQASELPLLIAVDEEGGTVARLANDPDFALPQYESAAAVGATGDPEQAREMGRTIGNYLKEYGFNMDFAPDADVLTNPDNPVIGSRSFSQDAETVAQMATAMAQGLQEQDILPVFKHFPGHGDTAEDSHSGIAYTRRTLEELQACEFLPFRLLDNGFSPDELPAVMAGHIAAPALGDGDTPASLSYHLVTEILRGEVLDGAPALVVTDSMAMGAITELYSPGEAAVRALQAGCDLVLMPDSLPEAFDAVLAAVEDGTISAERLDESVARILRVKQQYAGLELPQEGER